MLVVASLPSRTQLRLRLGEELFDLGLDRLVVGRSRSCEIRLQEDTVSRLHAAFVWRDGSICVEDLGSSNGTFVNGRRLEAPCVLAPGDTVRFGALRGTIEAEGDLGGPTASAPPADLGPDYTIGVVTGVAAGFWFRAAAVLLDTVLFTVGSVVPFAPLLAAGLAERFLLSPEVLPPSLRIMALIAGGSGALWVLYAWYYIIHGWARRGGTPGMRLMGLRLLDWRHRVPIGYPRAILRFAALAVTLLTLGLGFVLVALRADRRALHDLLAGTLVVRRPAAL